MGLTGYTKRFLEEAGGERGEGKRWMKYFKQYTVFLGVAKRFFLFSFIEIDSVSDINVFDCTRRTTHLVD